MLPKFGFGRPRFGMPRAFASPAVSVGTLMLRDMMIPRPRRYEYPAVADAQRNAIEIQAAARSDYRLPVAWRPRHANPRRDVVGVEVDRIGQPLQVVTEPGVDRDAGARPPFVLCEQS